MNRWIRKLLEHLSDDKWHLDPPKGVGEKSVNLAHELGLVRTKRIILKRHQGVETFRVDIRITARGKKELGKHTN